VFEKRWWLSSRAQLGVERTCEMYGCCMELEDVVVLGGITIEGFMHLKG